MQKNAVVEWFSWANVEFENLLNKAIVQSSLLSSGPISSYVGSLCSVHGR